MTEYKKIVYELINFLKDNDNIDSIVKKCKEDVVFAIKFGDKLKKYINNIMEIINNEIADPSAEDDWMGWNN